MQWEYQSLIVGADTPGLFNLTGGQVNHAALQQEMNRLGNAGWELVTAVDTNYIQGATREIVLLFKRPRIVTAAPVE